MLFELAPFARDTGYGEAIVSLTDLKEHVAVDADEEEFDDLLALLRDAAVDMVEQYCELRLGESLGLEWQAEGLPEADRSGVVRVRLGTGPVTAIGAMSYLDSSNAPHDGDVATLRIARALRGEIVPIAGESWPSDVDAGVTITFDAGFTAENRPPALVQAVKMFAAHLFENREAVITGTISGEVPLGFKALCAPWVPVRV